MRPNEYKQNRSVQYNKGRGRGKAPSDTATAAEPGSVAKDRGGVPPTRWRSGNRSFSGWHRACRRSRCPRARPTLAPGIPEFPGARIAHSTNRFSHPAPLLCTLAPSHPAPHPAPLPAKGRGRGRGGGGRGGDGGGGKPSRRPKSSGPVPPPQQTPSGSAHGDGYITGEFADAAGDGPARNGEETDFDTLVADLSGTDGSASHFRFKGEEVNPRCIDYTPFGSPRRRGRRGTPGRGVMPVPRAVLSTPLIPPGFILPR